LKGIEVTWSANDADGRTGLFRQFPEGNWLV
jgi:hypothetical protein